MCGGSRHVAQPSPQTPPRVLTHVAPDFNAPRQPFIPAEPNMTGRSGGPLLVEQAKSKLGDVKPSNQRG